MKASHYISDFEQEISVWPKPIQLSHPGGNVYLTLKSHRDYMEATWSGHITAGDVVTASKMFLALMQTCQCPDKLLSDKTDVTGDWSEVNDWLEYEWLPQIIQAGLHHIAHIYSINMFSRLSARDLYLRVTPRIQMQNFDNRKEGLRWLLESKAPRFEQIA